MKVQPMVLMEALDHHESLILLKQTQICVWVYIIMLIIVVCLLLLS